MNPDTTRRAVAVALVVVLAAAGGAIGSGAAQDGGPPAPPHRLYGTVTDTDGTPIANVTVEVRYDGQVVASQATAADGSFDVDVSDPNENIDGERLLVTARNASEAVTFRSAAVTALELAVEPVETDPNTRPLRNGIASFNLPARAGVSNVSLSIPGASGEATVRNLSALPAGVPEPPQGERLVTLNISAPNPAAGSATVEITLGEGTTDVEPTRLTVVHYADDEWRSLNTTLVSEQPVVLKATVSGFSPFVVVESEQSSDGSGGGGGGGFPFGGFPPAETTTTTTQTTTTTATTTTAQTTTTTTTATTTIRETTTRKPTTQAMTATATQETTTTGAPTTTTRETTTQGTTARETTTSGGTPGFGVPVTFTALLATVLLRRRWAGRFGRERE